MTVERTRAEETAPASAGASPIIQATDVVKTYDTGRVEVHALRGVSLTIQRGEMVAIMGPSGCGKTTLLNCLSGLDTIDSGLIMVGGADINRMSDNEKTEYRARRMGFVFQFYNLLPVLSSVENVELPLLVSGVSAREARQKALAALGAVHLGDWAEHRPGELSGGQRQRVTIARALVNDPKLIFLDEPTLGLDPAGQRQMLQLIRNLARQRGTTVILSTHFLDEVEQACPRVIILNRGRVVAQGTVAEMIRKAAAPRTGRFQVPSEMQETALTALKGARGVASAAYADGHDGSLMITLDEASLVTAQSGGAGMRGAITALMDAGVPILSFELEGSRLSDAFFSMTKED